MIPVVQIILALAGVIFGGKITGLLGLNPPPANDTSTQGRAYVLSDHPAAAAPSPSTGGGPAAPPAPGTGPQLPPAPPVKQIAADAVRNPWALFGIAAVGLTMPLLISQLRAGFHEAAGAGASVYSEAKGAYTRVDRADDYTGNRSRRRK